MMPRHRMAILQDADADRKNMAGSTIPVVLSSAKKKKRWRPRMLGLTAMGAPCWQLPARSGEPTARPARPARPARLATPQSVLPACSHLDGEIPRPDRNPTRRQGGHPAVGPVCPASDPRTWSISAVGGWSALSVPAQASGLPVSAQCPVPSAHPPGWVLPACSHLDVGESTLITIPVRGIHTSDPQRHHPGEPIGFRRLYHGVHGHS